MTTSLMAELRLRTSALKTFKARNAVTRSGNRRRGFYPSRFGSLPWESPLERDLIGRLDGSWSCKDLVTQPMQIEIPCRHGGSFGYTPDAVARLHCGSLTAIECKPEHLLLDKEVRRHKAVLACLGSLDIRFRVLTERELHAGARQANAILLSRHFNAALKPTQVQRLQAQTQSSRYETFGQLVEAIGLQNARSALARGFSYFDTSAALVNDTPLFDIFLEAHDAADFLFA